MQKALALTMFALSSLASPAQSASVSLVSLSLRVESSTAKDSLTGLTWTLELASTGRPQEPNGELRPSDANIPYSHQSNFILIDPSTGEPLVFPFVLDVPDPGDSNGNGLGDFFDTDAAIASVQTSGRHPTVDGKGADFTATWVRPAGALEGTVRIDLSSFGLKFTAPFSIPHYEGKLSYTYNPPALPGTIRLTNVMDSTEQLSGPLALTLTNNSQLGYADGAWTNQTGGRSLFSSVDSLDRAGTNYVALFEFEDGQPQTSDPDYTIWLLVLHSGDSDNNGILDLVEKITGPPAPRLEIGKSAQGIELTVLGMAGRSYVLETTGDLKTNNWAAGQTVILSGSSEVVALPVSGPAKFFRLREASGSAGIPFLARSR